MTEICPILSILSQFVQVLSQFCPLKIIDKSTLFDLKIGCGQKLRNLVDFFYYVFITRFSFFCPHIKKLQKTIDKSVFFTGQILDRNCKKWTEIVNSVPISEYFIIN